MPVYEYKCLNCNRRFEKEVSYKELSEYKPTCPVCLYSDCQRVYSPVGIIFNGNGFYKTDNRKEEDV